ncbi:MAG: protein-L-isoaspartate(D-aspartate) O-methyltransferase [Candidatus Hydrogenedentota bacterium]
MYDQIFSLRFVRFTSALLIMMAGAHAQEDGDSENEFRRLRERMVDTQLMKGILGRASIQDEAVIAAMKAVPRHRFVPEAVRSDAYADSPLPIGFSQTISQPYVVAVMTEALQPKPDDVVLEIGTGSGYQAAVLAQIVKHVYTIEIVPELGERAAATLNELGYANVTTRVGDGYQGWPEHAPFDGIIVTAAPDHVPVPLKQQLKPGGRLVIPVGKQEGIQQLVVLQKQDDGSFEQSVIERVRFVPLTRNNR